MSRFVQLPNGDLWRGRPKDETQRPDTFEMSGTDKPEDVIADMIAKQKGEVLSCVFCGENFNRKGELDKLYGHIEKQHPSSVKPPSDAEILMLNRELENPEIVARIEAPEIK
jgi:hypothetical protein